MTAGRPPVGAVDVPLPLFDPLFDPPFDEVDVVPPLPVVVVDDPVLPVEPLLGSGSAGELVFSADSVLSAVSSGTVPVPLSNALADSP